MTSTSRSLAYYRKEGYLCWIVEKYNSFTKKRTDLFNIIDIIAIGEDTIGIQSCGQAFSEHDKKIVESEYKDAWLKAGNRLILIGWRKVKKKRGGVAMVWMSRIKEYGVDHEVK